MPFTFAHPAVVLPFLKFRHPSISVSALIIGSIAPDFEYFIRMKLTGRYSHSVEGMFLLDLPVAFCLYFVFHQLVKEPLIRNLPVYIQSRLSPLVEFHYLKYLGSSYYWFVACLLVGIGSHLLWDSFTHPQEYFVMRIDFLMQPVNVLGVISLPVFKWLQHFSTLIGFVVIGWVFHKMPVHSSFGSIHIRFWLVTSGFAAIVFLIRASLGFEYFGDQVATAISALCMGIIGSSILMRFTND